MGDRSRHATPGEFQCGTIVRNILRGAVVVFRERAGRRTSSPWSFDHRQNDDLRRGSVYLWLAARDCRHAFGVSWGGTEAGFDALALARTDLGLPLDEITLANPRTAEQVIYKVASGTKGPRATSAGHLRETAHASVLVFSTGEKSLAQFIGSDLQEGARKRLVDIPAEVQPGTAFETIPPDQIHVEGKR